jgi:hypothetical protein
MPIADLGFSASEAEPSAALLRSLRALFSTTRNQGLSEELLVALIDEQTDSLKRRSPRGGGLTADEARFLVESGEFTEQELAKSERDVARGDLAAAERATRLRAIASTIGAAEVAARLNLDDSSVRARQGKGLLYAFLSGRKRRYPLWQFIEGTDRVVPGLGTVTKAFPAEWHPATVQGFMTTPQDGLRIDAAKVAPTEWLLNGGDPSVVVGILESTLLA